MRGAHRSGIAGEGIRTAVRTPLRSVNRADWRDFDRFDDRVAHRQSALSSVFVFARIAEIQHSPKKLSFVPHLASFWTGPKATRWLKIAKACGAIRQARHPTGYDRVTETPCDRGLGVCLLQQGWGCSGDQEGRAGAASCEDWSTGRGMRLLSEGLRSMTVDMWNSSIGTAAP